MPCDSGCAIRAVRLPRPVQLSEPVALAPPLPTHFHPLGEAA